MRMNRTMFLSNARHTHYDQRVNRMRFRPLRQYR